MGYNDRTARMAVPGGWVYLSSFATRDGSLTVSLAFGPAEPL
jgi:hypothetical protein